MRDGKSASIVMSNTTDTGAPAADASHAQSNTEPDPKTDLRMQLREALIRDVFPALGKP